MCSVDPTNHQCILMQSRSFPTLCCSLDTNRNSWYYFNEETLTSQWEHPLNAVYREKVAEARMNLTSSTHPFNSETFPTIGKLPKSLPPLKKLGGASRPTSTKLLNPLGIPPKPNATEKEELEESKPTPQKKVDNNDNDEFSGKLTAKPFMQAIQEAKYAKKVEPEVNFIKRAVPLSKKGTGGLTLTGEFYKYLDHNILKAILLSYAI